MAKTSTVDQIKSRLFALPELSGCSKDDHVLGDASGKRLFVVEFQRLSRVDPSLVEAIESGQTVRLSLSVRESARGAAAGASAVSPIGGTPGLTRRKLAPGIGGAEASFSTPQPLRKAASPSPRAAMLVKSPRDPALPKVSSNGSLLMSPREDEIARMRQEREAVLREKEALLKQKKERFESDRRAEEARKQELADKEREELRKMQEHAREREERSRALREAGRRDEEAARRAEMESKENSARQKQQILVTSEDTADELMAAESRLREFEKKQRERASGSQIDESIKMNDDVGGGGGGSSVVDSSDTEREELWKRLKQEEVQRREQRMEAERLAELERKQRARDQLAADQEAALYEDAESTMDEMRRHTMIEIERKKAEVEAKRAELEKKMRELEERQKNLDLRRRESEHEDREEDRKKDAAARLLLEKRRSSGASDVKLDILGEKDTLWEMLREKQIAEDAKRKQLIEEKKKAEEGRKEKELKEKELKDSRERDILIMEMREKEAREKEAREKEAREKEAREKEAREKELREKEAREKEAREKEVREKEALARNPSLQKSLDVVPSLDSTLVSSSDSTASPKTKNKHERRGSFGFLKKVENATAASAPTLAPPPSGAAEKSKGTPLLSRISLGVKGVRSVLVQRRNSFRSSKVKKWKIIIFQMF